MEGAFTSGHEAVDFDSFSRARHAVGDSGSRVGGGGFECKCRFHQDMEAPVRADEDCEISRGIPGVGVGDVEDAAGVIEKSVHSRNLSARSRNV